VGPQHDSHAYANRTFAAGNPGHNR